MTEPVYDFSERVVVVTGGSRGVGAGIVAAFAAAGAHVVTCGRHEAEVEGAVFVTADVRKPAEAERVVAKAVEHFGRLDVLVNNAGGLAARAGGRRPRPASSRPSSTSTCWRRCGARSRRTRSWRCRRTAVHRERGQRVGAAALAGRLGLRRRQGRADQPDPTLAVEWAPSVRVNCVSAGLLDTGAGDEFYGGPEGMARVAATVPLGRMGTPGRRGPGLPVPGERGAAYVSGANLVVHGGGEWPAFLRGRRRYLSTPVRRRMPGLTGAAPPCLRW